MPDETPASEIASVEPSTEPAASGGQPAAAPSEPQGPVGHVGSPGVPGAVAEPPPAPPIPEGGLPPAPAPAETPASSKVMPAEWPCLGYAGPQPWEADNPPTLTQNHLMVSSGSAGVEVVELAALLEQLGYATTISTGQNPHAIYDSGVSDGVRAFCAAYGVVEDPQVRTARTEDTVGPWLWEALVRAVHKKLAEDSAGD